MYPWEREVYINLAAAKVKKENEKIKQQNAASKVNAKSPRRKF